MKSDELITRLGHKFFTDARDVLNTPRAQERFFVGQRDAAQLQTVLRTTELDEPMLVARLVDLEARRARTIEKQLDLMRQHDETPDPSGIKDARERAKAFDDRERVLRQLQLLADGTLLAAPGVTYERLDYIDERIAALKEKITALRARHAAAVAEAEALLAEPVSR